MTSTDQRALSVLELFPPGHCRRMLLYIAQHQEDLNDPSRCGPVVFHLGPGSKVSVSDQRIVELHADG